MREDIFIGFPDWLYLLVKNSLVPEDRVHASLIFYKKAKILKAYSGFFLIFESQRKNNDDFLETLDPFSKLDRPSLMCLWATKTDVTAESASEPPPQAGNMSSHLPQPWRKAVPAQRRCGQPAGESARVPALWTQHLPRDVLLSKEAGILELGNTGSSFIKKVTENKHWDQQLKTIR